jgi:hypothetical protein
VVSVALGTFMNEPAIILRLRKARVPQSSWADVDIELWLLYVSAPDSPFLTE